MFIFPSFLDKIPRLSISFCIYTYTRHSNMEDLQLAIVAYYKKIRIYKKYFTLFWSAFFTWYLSRAFFSSSFFSSYSATIYTHIWWFREMIVVYLYVQSMAIRLLWLVPVLQQVVSLFHITCCYVHVMVQTQQLLDYYYGEYMFLYKIATIHYVWIEDRCVDYVTWMLHACKISNDEWMNEWNIECFFCLSLKIEYFSRGNHRLSAKSYNKYMRILLYFASQIVATQ